MPGLFFGEARLRFLPDVLASFNALTEEYDVVFVEGAGSPAETNLRHGDIANMGFAVAGNVPVCLVADIERGGSIASLVGTHEVLSQTDRSLVTGYLINKFRGDPTLFDDGLTDITRHTGWQSYGVVPWLPELAHLPEEDAVPLENEQLTHDHKPLKIAIPMLPRIANFDDFDPLRLEAEVEVLFIPPGKPIPLDVDAVIIPGTKSTISDLEFVKSQAWDIDILALARQGRTILGICGGLQMLGNTLSDPTGQDGVPSQTVGLGLLDITTTMKTRKTLRQTSGSHVATGSLCTGYEIHMGETSGRDSAQPFAQTKYGNDGATNPAGNVSGTYLHGIFANDSFRGAWLNQLRRGHGSSLRYEQGVEAALDQLAHSLSQCLDFGQLLEDAGASEYRANQARI